MALIRKFVELDRDRVKRSNLVSSKFNRGTGIIGDGGHPSTFYCSLFQRQGMFQSRQRMRTSAGRSIVGTARRLIELRISALTYHTRDKD